MKLILIVIIFLLMNAFLIISNNNIPISNKANLQTFSSLYYSWLSDISQNTVKSTVYAVKMNWMPKE